MNESQKRFDYTDAEEAQYDRRDHQGFTPDEIRARLGKTASSIERPPEEPLTPSDHKPATRKAASGVQYGDNMRVETPDGRPLEDDGSRPTEEERQRIHKYTQNWREIGKKAIEDGTHETTD